MTGTPVPTGREARCRYLRRDGDRCPNPALDPDEKAIQICGKHAAKVMQLVAEAKAAHIGRTGR